MPNRPPTICRDCRQIATSNGYCEAHQKDNRAIRTERQRQQKRRDSGLKALYDSRQWREGIRPRIAARDKLCRLGILCGGTGLITDIDHIIRADEYIAMHGGDQRYFFDESNLQGVCHADHTRKTALENKGLWPPKN